MDIKSVLLVFTLLAECFALATLEGPEDDLSSYFENTDINFRMFGGYDAVIGRHPHMVALTEGVTVRTFICGGSLISHWTVLSAAHCVATTEDPIKSMTATVGTNRWNSGGTTYAFSDIAVHPNYVPSTSESDICLLITAWSVVFTDRVQPVALSFEYVPAGVSCNVAGWGSFNIGSDTSDTLMELTTTTIIMDDCAALYGAIQAKLNQRPVNTQNEICTLNSPGHGFCYGDSGSALTRVDTGEQIGIVSWMRPCARGFPDVYARISAHQAWIQANAV